MENIACFLAILTFSFLFAIFSTSVVTISQVRLCLKMCLQNFWHCRKQINKQQNLMSAYKT